MSLLSYRPCLKVPSPPIWLPWSKKPFLQLYRNSQSFPYLLLPAQEFSKTEYKYPQFIQSPKIFHSHYIAASPASPYVSPVPTSTHSSGILLQSELLFYIYMGGFGIYFTRRSDNSQTNLQANDTANRVKSGW